MFLEVFLLIFEFKGMLVVRGRFCQNFGSNNMGNTCTYLFIPFRPFLFYDERGYIDEKL